MTNQEKMKKAVEILKEFCNVEFEGDFINVVYAGFEFSIGDVNGCFTCDYGLINETHDFIIEETIPLESSVEELLYFIRSSILKVERGLS